jgi:hypothetical protein
MRGDRRQVLVCRATRVLPRILSAAGAGLLIFAGVVSAATSSEYDGATSQKHAFRISLDVSHGAVTSVQLSALVTKGPAALCAANVGDNLFQFSHGGAKIVRHKTFAGKLTDGRTASVTIKGAITAHAVKGSFTVDAFFTQDTAGVLKKVTCSSGEVTFTAAASGGPAGGARYSGTIPPGDPISFRVSANGRAVDGLVVQYEATTCPGAGNGPAPKAHFKTLSIKSAGFSGTATHKFPGQVIGSRHFPGNTWTYRISATFFGRLASGQVSVTEREPGVPTCSESTAFTANAK